MRIRTLILCLLCCVASALAKDVITKTDGTKLDVKVEEITETVVKYRKASNPTGPIYTIPLTSVATILYENGDSDTFTDLQITSPTQYLSPSDEELMRIAETQSYSNQTGNVSDAELLQMVNNKSTAEKLIDKAKKKKMIGWIGGGVLFSWSLIIGIIINHDNQFQSDGGDPYALAEGVGMGLVCGGAWWLGFNLKAKSLMKQAREMELYSATLIKNEIFNFGDKSLTAGVDLIGNRMTHSHTIGLSLGFNF